MSTLEIILFVLFLAFCIYNAIFLIIHPVYTEEELKAMREKKKMKKKLRREAIIDWIGKHTILGGHTSGRGQYW